MAQPLFATTHWGVVLATAHQEAPEAAAALGEEEKFSKSVRKPVFDQLRAFLLGEKGSATCAEIAAASLMTEGAVRVAVHRLRQRYRELFREEVAHTVEQPSELNDEIPHLFSVLTT